MHNSQYSFRVGAGAGMCSTIVSLRWLFAWFWPWKHALPSPITPFDIMRLEDGEGLIRPVRLVRTFRLVLRPGRRPWQRRCERPHELHEGPPRNGAQARGPDAGTAHCMLYPSGHKKKQQHHLRLMEDSIHRRS